MAGQDRSGRCGGGDRRRARWLDRKPAVTGYLLPLEDEAA